jgi:hypothetical protein
MNPFFAIIISAQNLSKIVHIMPDFIIFIHCSGLNFLPLGHPNDSHGNYVGKYGQEGRVGINLYVLPDIKHVDLHLLPL